MTSTDISSNTSTQLAGPSKMKVRMRGFAVGNFGEPASVHDLAVPAADGAVLDACGSLESTRSTTTSSAADRRLDVPFVAGIGFAGVAERVPAGQHGLRAGDRVFGMARTHGSYAEYTAVAPGARMEPLARIPTASPMTRPPRFPSRRLLRSGRLTSSRSPQASTSW